MAFRTGCFSWFKVTPRRHHEAAESAQASSQSFPGHIPHLAQYMGVFGNSSAKDFEAIWHAIQEASRDLQLYYSCCDPNQAKQDFHTRVNVLEASIPTGLNNPKTHVFINEESFYSANFVKNVFGPEGQRLDIAAQAPNIKSYESHLNSLENFLELIWNQNICLVVNLVEKGEKQAKYDYLPVLMLGHNIGQISICKTQTEAICDYLVLYTFEIRKQGQNRTLKILHFDSWADHELPDIQELKKVVATTQQLQVPGSPKLIHCHAGVYRTGVLFTLLNIEACRQQAQIDQLNVPQLIVQLRHSRFRMVRNEQDLKLIEEFMADSKNESS